jgi:NAD(P)-dependent dehydrogenase (short-subunit alcohol dehydrogenase family)
MASNGKVALVTGGGSGIGKASALALAREGFAVVVAGRRPEPLNAVVGEIEKLQVKALGVPTDVSDPASVEALFAKTKATFGRLDVLFNNAGVQIDGAANGLSDGGEAALERSMAVNLWAPYRLSMALLPLLLKGSEPRIVNVSSGAGNFESLRSPKIASYRLSKWALNGLTLILSGELEGKVAVNAFDPGWVKTDLGGRNAPGHPRESALGALALVTLPFSETGKFWKDGNEIPF